MQIKAYTLTEALITIVLSSIIVVVSYTLVTTISKQLSVFQKENKEELLYNLMDSTLYFDINYAENYKYTTNTIALYYYDNDTINYYFNKNEVIRESKTKLDTFKINVLNVTIEETFKTSNLKLKLKLFNNELNNFYTINKPLSKVINKKYFNEN